MSEYITEIDISLNKSDEEHLKSNGFIQNPVNLNKRASGDEVHLWYKKGCGSAITNIQFTFSDSMNHGLKGANYNLIKKNLNSRTGGDHIYLWYKYGCSECDVPIVDLFVTTEQQEEPQLFHMGWERLACDLNRKTAGSRIFLWVKRDQPTYISEITATAGFECDVSLFKEGFFRVDENINRGAGGKDIFLWYRQSTDITKALKDLAVSVNEDQENELKKKHFDRVSQDVNEGTRGKPVYVWFRKTCNKPIKTLTVIPGALYKLPYERAGVQVIDRNLNKGNEGAMQFLSFYQ
ncbi:hypothetical protein CRENBAI_013434 [Crenichthys baileyi]|uniref:MABP domain-containing protein n=1 Tax=Crenichthys baileyi TaxID=28760 RepID=A0AAV9SRR5_9TELE